jgi:prophage maintenance system killer protein
VSDANASGPIPNRFIDNHHRAHGADQGERAERRDRERNRDEHEQHGGPDRPTADFATKAAVLCWHLVKNHPLPDGNKRCAFLATVQLVERNRRTWIPAPGHPDETDRVIRTVASGGLSEAAFRDWIAAARCG